MTVYNDNVYSWSISDVLCKVWKIPYGNDRNNYAIFCLNHEIWFCALHIINVYIYIYHCKIWSAVDACNICYI